MEFEHEDKSRRVRVWLALGFVSVLAVAVLLFSGRGNVRTVSSNRENVEEGCILMQTIRYARCGHEVTRRVEADKEYKGCTLEQMQQAFADWSITSFSPTEIVMDCTQPMYCPDHLVVMPDGAGVLGVYENVYGDGYALKTQLDTPLSTLPDTVRETVHLGVGFASAKEIEQWLEGFES